MKKIFYLAPFIIYMTIIYISSTDNYETAPMIPMTEIPKEIEEMGNEKLKSKKDNWWIRVLTNSYSWLNNNEEIYWIIDDDSGESFVSLRTANNQYVCTSCIDTGPSHIGELLFKNLGMVDAHSVDVNDLSQVIVDLYRDPRNNAATEVFLQEIEVDIEDWIVDSGNDEDSLVDLCRKPVLEIEDKTWVLKFHVINHHGGVEQWVIKGDVFPHSLSIEIIKISENNTYFNPDEY